MSFNMGKPYHGTEVIMNGKLKGKTDDTDYFYFLCPECNEILRILEFEIHDRKEKHPYLNSYKKKKPKYGFTIVYKIYCDNCKHEDFVKISNMGLQGGDINQNYESV